MVYSGDFIFTQKFAAYQLSQTGQNIHTILLLRHKTKKKLLPRLTMKER